MSSCVRNIRTKNYQNLIIGFQVTAKNVGDVFFGTQCSYHRSESGFFYLGHGLVSSYRTLFRCCKNCM